MIALRTPVRVPSNEVTHGFVALFIFLANVAIFISFADPVIQGYGDVVRGWNAFTALWGGTWDDRNQIELRLMMVGITLLELGILTALRLVEWRVALFYLVLPMAAYLATKIKPEFLFFPLALIRTDLRWRGEIIVLSAIIWLSLFLEENNGFVILFFRITLFVLRRWRPPLWIIVISIAGILAADASMDILARYFERLHAYSWTRNVVNPEYSILETIIVFLSSMVISINPQTDFIVGLPATILMFAVSLPKQPFRRSTIRGIIYSPEFRALLLTVLAFTSMTHAFQNARYYLFYVPVLRASGGARLYHAMLFASLPITYTMMVFYKFVLGL